MNEDIIESIQRNGKQFIPDQDRKVKGVSGGAFGFSFGLTFSEEVQKQYGFRTKMTLRCDELEKHGKGVLILVDEARTSKEMRELAVTYQHLAGEERNIAIAMAGLPQAVSSVLNDKVLTFLNRAYKTKLGFIATPDIYYYMETFKKSGVELAPEQVEKLAEAAEGLKELVGRALKDLEENVYVPILTPLSDMDRAFLDAMAVDDAASRVADIGKRLHKENSYIQPYRARLIDAGIIEAPRQGEVKFAVPYLKDYLRKGSLF